MFTKEKHIRSGIRKIDRYIKENRTKKLKRLYETFCESQLQHVFIKEINSTHGNRKRTYLHKCCAKGDSSMVETLLKYGGDIACCDANGNNILHHALNYVLESCDGEFFESTVLHLIALSSQDILEMKNQYGETAEELLTEAMNLLNNKKKTFLLESDSEDEKFNEKEWNEKLFFEMASEGRYMDNESYAQDEFSDTYRKTKAENFEEWGDRMRGEYNAKYNPKPGKRTKQGQEPKMVDEDTQHAEGEKIKYGPTLVDDLRKKLEMFELREQYETKCKHVLAKTTSLKFEDIPWPITFSLEDFVQDMDTILDRIIELFCHGFEASDKLKYLKKQQVRWHPDRFLQKCGDRLPVEEKEDVMKVVNNLSQKINSTVDLVA